MTYEKLYAFLLEHYRRSRFEGRGMDKAKRITEMYMEDLQKYGCSYISRHEDVQGQGFKFDSDLNIFRGDYVEYPNNAGNLTHIF